MAENPNHTPFPARAPFGSDRAQETSRASQAPNPTHFAAAVLPPEPTETVDLAGVTPLFLVSPRFN